MKTFLILGAGTGGTMMANKLAKKLDSQEWKIILVDRVMEHYYQPGFLFVPFGYYKPESIVQPKKKFVPSGVDFINSDIELIEPDKSRVTLKEGKRVISYDQLLIATGTDIHPEEIEGMQGAGWHQNIFDFYTFDGSVKLHEFLTNFNGGRIVINIAEMPIKCPVAPLEFAFLADYYFHQRGIRNKVEIVYSTPLSGAFTKPIASKMLGDVLTKKNILVEPDFAISGVDSTKNIVSSYDGRELNYDLLVAIPTNMGADVIGRSGMGDDLNFVPTNKQTLQTNQWQNVWVIGDAANVPASKAGSVVHYEAETLLENILEAIAGKDLTAAFDGHSTCHITSGYNKSLLIDFSYDVEPLTGVYPMPVLGPFPLLKESFFNYIGKLSFRWIYWNIMLRGIPFPLPPAFSMAGKIKPNSDLYFTKERKMSVLDSLKFDADGYLVDEKLWNKEVAEAIAKREGVTLTERSWVVINYARKEFETKGEAPTLRAITKNTDVDTKELYSLFPGGPGKLAAKVSGLHKPTGCI